MNDFHYEFATVGKNSHRYRFIDEGRDNKQAMLLLHGFPDQAWGWKHQIRAWRSQYRLIVPDMLGYGESDKPNDFRMYSTRNLCEDLASLLQHLGIAKAIVVAHDWGAAVAWRFALWKPQYIQSLVLFSVAYYPPPKQYFSPEQAAQIVPTFGYQAYFADPSSTKEIEANLDDFLRALFPKAGLGATPMLGLGELQSIILRKSSLNKNAPLVIDEEEFSQYREAFKKGGMNGPLSYYRNNLTRYEDENEANLPDEIPSTIPVLFFHGTQDLTCPSKHVKRMPALVKNVKIVTLEGKGHWLLLEAKDEINSTVLDWLEQLPSNQQTKAML